MDKVLALEHWRENDIFNKQEKTVLKYTEAVTLSGAQVTEELMEELRVYYDEDGIVELTALIAFQNLSTNFNNALDVPAQGFCDISYGRQKTSKEGEHE